MKNLQLTFTLLCTLLLTYNLEAQLPQVTVSGEITSNTTWTNDNIYILNGFVYVEDGADLTIEAGTIIRGQNDTKGTLIVTRGSKLFANGTVDQPIVFTSNQPQGSRNYGDWGGIILLGYAPINVPGGTSVIEGGVDTPEGDGVFGGDDAADNSGSLTYVRIEYPGIAFVPGNEINGLTCGGVGSGTVIDHVMVSRSGDDSFEFFGGTVNPKYLIAHNGLDDDFDTDFGFSGNIQFALSKRDPLYADVSGSNGFESDNDATGSTNSPQTNPTFSNVTIIGPIQTEGDVINVNYKRGAHIRRNSSLDLFNSVIVGYPSGIMIDGSLCEASAMANDLKIQNTVIAGHNNDFELAVGSTFDINAWFTTPAYNNSIFDNSGDILLTDPYSVTSPNFIPMDGSPLLAGASFDAPELAGFTPVTYRGAFGSTNWTKCWANWDPQFTDYDNELGTVALASADFSFTNSDLTVNFTNTSSNALSYVWDFGDETTTDDFSTDPNPSYTYPGLGVYDAKLIATGTCDDIDSIAKTVDISVGVVNIDAIKNISLFPNPAISVLHLAVNAFESFDADMQLFDMTGKIVYQNNGVHFNAGATTLKIDVMQLNEGIYFVNLISKGTSQSMKVIIAHN